MADPVALDPEGMLPTVESAPEQWARALELAAVAPPPPTGADLRAVLVVGMGGSGVAGDVAAQAAHETGTVPVLAVKGHTLPALVGPRTLVVAVSHSGDTEETLAAVEQALAAGAPVHAVASGGRLTDLAGERGLALTAVPAGGQPRANLPYLATAVLAAVERAGAAPGGVEALAGVPDLLGPLVERWASGGAEVGAAAEAVGARVPVFHAPPGWAAVVALRGKCQVNENAERPAFWHQVPELDHNEVVGWARPGAGAGFALVQLRDPAEHPRVARRVEITHELLAPRFDAVVEHWLTGPTGPARFAAGALFVDLLSVHLALRAGVDPTPVAAIAELKRRLAAGEEQQRA